LILQGLQLRQVWSSVRNQRLYRLRFTNMGIIHESEETWGNYCIQKLIISGISPAIYHTFVVTNITNSQFPFARKLLRNIRNGVHFENSIVNRAISPPLMQPEGSLNVHNNFKLGCLYPVACIRSGSGVSV
jgi:hypothetical protein